LPCRKDVLNKVQIAVNWLANGISGDKIVYVDNHKPVTIRRFKMENKEANRQTTKDFVKVSIYKVLLLLLLCLLFSGKVLEFIRFIIK